MELSVPVEGGHLWADDTGGDGPPLVLLHPGWGDSSIWLPVVERLAAQDRVIRYDTRGFGKSPAPAAPFSQLGDLTAVLDSCGAERVVLVGHSGGGGTAIGLALADRPACAGCCCSLRGCRTIRGRKTILMASSSMRSMRLETGMGSPA